MKDFFEGLRIVELSSVLAGPVVGSFFAELGATVVKIENQKSHGDVTRSWRMAEEKNNIGPSAYYHSANYNKSIVFLDFTIDEDLQQLYTEIKLADIVITNYQKHTAVKLKIDLKTISEVNKKAIIAQLNAYEYDDPRPGFDLVMQAETGFISMTGSEDALAKMPVAMIDLMAAHQMKEAILMGLIRKIKSNQGSVIHVSLYKSAIASLANQATNFLMSGNIAMPLGTLHPNIAPYGEVATTKDNKYVMLAIGSDHQFQKFLLLLETNTSYIKDLIFEASFITNSQRLYHRVILNDFIKNYVKEMNFDVFMREMNLHGIPVSTIKNISEVFNDPLAQSMVIDNSIEESEGKYVSNIAFYINNEY
jgi:crotonobetainyl-CoA:carnitine CoA-transferase CaiB-like acyl-CoA transferase